LFLRRERKHGETNCKEWTHGFLSALGGSAENFIPWRATGQGSLLCYGVA
jgi:hypothetical protein